MKKHSSAYVVSMAAVAGAIFACAAVTVYDYLDSEAGRAGMAKAKASIARTADRIKSALACDSDTFDVCVSVLDIEDDAE